MEMLNIYFARHPEDEQKKVYMFKVPIDKEVHKDVCYAVETKYGVKRVVAVTNSMVMPKAYVNELKPLFGATKLAPTIGEVVATIDQWGDKE